MGLLAVAINVAFWLLILLIQYVEAKMGTIPKRRTWRSAKPFLYFQDWHMALWGDLVGLSLVDYAFANSYFCLATQPLLIVAALVVGMVGVFLFHISRTGPRHRPDSGYPGRSTTSPHGYVHLVYFFAQSIACAAVVFLLAEGLLDLQTLRLAAMGGAVYILTYLADRFQGKLKPL
jgi:hypothetical protein